MKKLLSLLKGLLVSPLLIYIYDLVASPFNLTIPINILTVLIVGLLGIPGLIMLLAFSLVAF